MLQVVVQLQGDLVGGSGPLDFSAKKLLIPSLKVWPKDKQGQIPAAYTVCWTHNYGNILWSIAML